MEEKITDLRNLVEALSNYFEDSGEIDIETLDEIHSITLELFKEKHKGRYYMNPIRFNKISE